MKRTLVLLYSLSLSITLVAQPDYQAQWESALANNDTLQLRAVANSYLTHTLQVGDPNLIAFAYQRMAWVEVIGDNYSAQLRAYRYANQYYQEAGNWAYAGRAVLNRAIIYTDFGRWEDALAELHRAKALYAQSGDMPADLYEYLAKCHERTGRLDSATHLYQKLIQDNTDPISSYIAQRRLGWIYFKQGDTPAALAQWQSLLGQGQTDSIQTGWTHYFVARAYDSLADYVRAEEHYLHAISLIEGHYPTPHLYYGQMLETQGQPQQALAVYMNLLASHNFNLEQSTYRKELMTTVARAEYLAAPKDAVTLALLSTVKSDLIYNGLVGVDDARYQKEWAEHLKDESEFLAADLRSTQNELFKTKLFSLLILFITTLTIVAINKYQRRRFIRGVINKYEK